VRRMRSLLIALVLLALSASAVFAFRPLPSAATDGLATAGDAAGMTVPVRPDALPGSSRNQDRAEPDAAANADSATGEQTTHPDNHGADVSEAARATTPGGFANHGAYVSSIALDNAGQAAAKEHRQTPTLPAPAQAAPAPDVPTPDVPGPPAHP
jgi:hypothetical protein